MKPYGLSDGGVREQGRRGHTAIGRQAVANGIRSEWKLGPLAKTVYA